MTLNLFSEPQIEQELLALALGLLGDSADLSPVEQALVANIAPAGELVMVARYRADILKGGDPLGTLFCLLRSAADRKRRGQEFTPPVIAGRIGMSSGCDRSASRRPASWLACTCTSSLAWARSLAMACNWAEAVMLASAK